MDKTNKKYTFNTINIQDLYNIINREVQQHLRNLFIIYFVFNFQVQWNNTLILNNELFNEIVYKKEQSNEFKPREWFKGLPQNQQDIIVNKKRSFNVIIAFNDSKSLCLNQLKGLLMQQNKKIDVAELQKQVQTNFSSLKEQKDYQQMCNSIKLYEILKQEGITEVHFLIDSIESLIQLHPFIKDYLMNLHNPNQLCYPNEILQGQLYLGNWKHGTTIEILKNLNITHIVNATREVEINKELQDYFNLAGISFYRLDIQDLDDQALSKEDIEKVFQFIDNALNPLQQQQDTLNQQQNNRVLVHCAQGKSRSCTVICIYLIKKFKWTVDDTLDFVKKKREMASPNYGFINILNQLMIDTEKQ